MESRKTSRGRIVEKIPMLKARTRHFSSINLNGVLAIGSRATRRLRHHPLPSLFLAARFYLSPAIPVDDDDGDDGDENKASAACRSNDTFVLFPTRILRRPSGATGVKGPDTVERLDSPLRRGCLSRANRAEPPQPSITTLSSLSGPLSSPHPSLSRPHAIFFKLSSVSFSRS